MGKKLIIKGADFSANAIAQDRWYNQYESQGTNSNSIKTVAIAPEAVEALGIIGKPINRLKFYAIGNKSNCTIQVATYTGSRESGSFDLNYIGEKQYFDISEGENIITLSTPITLSEGQTIVLTDARQLTLANNTTDDTVEFANGNGWSYCTDSNGYMAIKLKQPIMFGYYSEY